MNYVQHIDGELKEALYVFIYYNSKTSLHFSVDCDVLNMLCHLKAGLRYIIMYSTCIGRQAHQMEGEHMKIYVEM